jgi:hypothetical protein
MAAAATKPNQRLILFIVYTGNLARPTLREHEEAAQTSALNAQIFSS